MKLGIIGDVHWSKYSSIVRSRGTKYSTRLENCIDSINWAESITSDCDKIIYLGDFFDNESLKSEELTALKELKWNDKEHIFLVGNHELGLNNLIFSSAHIFNLSNMEVIDKPTLIKDITSMYDICFLPYILENTGDVSDYLFKTTNKKIVFSHNDIAGIQMGKFLSKTGFTITSIENNCELFINGHLHNGSKVSDKIFNIGNLTGQNFSEDASVYSHQIFKLDTSTLDIEAFVNPFAFNFFKFLSYDDLVNYNFPSNSIVTAKLGSDLIDKAKEFVSDNSNIIAYRFILDTLQNNNTVVSENVSLSVNHLDKFQEFVLSKLGNEDIVKEELSEVLV